jgi:hypothetical protein
MNAILGTVAPLSSLHKSAMRQGFSHIAGGRLIPAECLFDSGALHSSYISKVFLESIRDSVADCIFPAEGNVFMADFHTQFKGILLLSSRASALGIAHYYSVPLDYYSVIYNAENSSSKDCQ